MMKARVHLYDGSSRLVDLGEVPEYIKYDNQAMFDYMLNVFTEQGIDVYDIVVVETMEINSYVH